mgnify:CR=1 FL=1
MTEGAQGAECERPVKELAYRVDDPRGFSVAAFYVGGEQNARIIITRCGKTFREFDYPAYRIWNIAAHFTEIVDDILRVEVTPMPDDWSPEVRL